MAKNDNSQNQSKKFNPTRIEDYPSELRGPTQNRYGGHKTQRMRSYKGNTFGAASPVKHFTKEECAEYEAKMREDGRLK